MASEESFTLESSSAGETPHKQKKAIQIQTREHVKEDGGEDGGSSEELYGLALILFNEETARDRETVDQSRDELAETTASPVLDTEPAKQQHYESETKCCNCCTQNCPQINQHLIVFKAFNFFFFAAVGSLFPYLSVFYKQIWLTAHETGILLGIRPLIQLGATPMWGIIADTYKKSKVIFMVSLVAWLVSNYSLSLVSPVHHLGFCKDNGTVGLVAEIFGSLRHKSHHGISALNSTKKSPPAAPNSTKKSPEESHPNNSEIVFHRGTVDKIKKAAVKQERLLLNPLRPKLKLSRIQSLSARNHIPTFSTESSNAHVMKVTGTQIKRRRALQMTDLDGLDLFTLNISEVRLSDVARESTERTFDFLNMQGHYPWPLDTVANYDSTQDSLDWQKHNHDQHLFTLLFLVTVIGNLIAAPAITLADTATLQGLGDSPEDYGKQRLWGAFGWGLGAFIVGASLSTIQEFKNCTNPLSVDYMPCFYAFAFLMGFSLLIGTLFEFPDRDTEADVSVWTGIKSLFNLRYVFFIFTVLHCGFSLGFIQVFLFWHLEDLGGTQLLFSIITAIHCASEVVVYRFSGQLISLFGHHMLIYAGLVCYAVRFFVYAFAQSSWSVLPFELLHGVSTAAVWSAAVTYVGLISGAPTTMQGILGSVHWGLGSGGGGIVGGLLISYVGTARSFFIFGVVSALNLLLFVLVNNWELVSRKCCRPNAQEQEYTYLENESLENGSSGASGR